jgi:hypothetical protein
MVTSAFFISVRNLGKQPKLTIIYALDRCWKNKVTNNLNLTKLWITQNQYIYPLLALVIPLAVRAIPEVLMGPYVLGFDTLGFYIPNTLLWLQHGANLGDFLATAPLCSK